MGAETNEQETSRLTEMKAPFQGRDPSVRPAKKGRWLALLVTSTVLLAGLIVLFVLGPFRPHQGLLAAEGQVQVHQNQPRRHLRLLLPALPGSEVEPPWLPPIVAYVSQRLNIDLIPERSESPTEAWQRLAQGAVQVALLPSVACAWAADNDDLEPLVVQSAGERFVATGLLVGRLDSPHPHQAQSRMCYAHELEGTSYLLPRLWLRSYGINPDGVPLWHRSGSHYQALVDLSQRQCDVAAIDGASLRWLDQQPLSDQNIRIVARTGQFPRSCWVGHRSAGPILAPLAAVLEDYAPPPVAPSAGAPAPEEVGFQAITPTTYRAVDLAVRLEGLTPP